MTREDAVEILQGARITSFRHNGTARVKEALEMAIESLKTEPTDTDLISRQATIRWVKTECNPYGKPTIDFESGKKVIKHLKQMPSADAVQGWIPCSERLPKAEDMYQPPEQRYLCQLEAHGVRKFCVLSRLKGAVSPFWDWYGIAVYDSDVIAWMPLPEPYKGGDTE